VKLPEVAVVHVYAPTAQGAVAVKASVTDWFMVMWSDPVLADSVMTPEASDAVQCSPAGDVVTVPRTTDE
jgi:hypothetical protein